MLPWGGLDDRNSFLCCRNSDKKLVSNKFEESLVAITQSSKRSWDIETLPVNLHSRCIRKDLDFDPLVSFVIICFTPSLMAYIRNKFGQRAFIYQTYWLGNDSILKYLTLQGDPARRVVCLRHRSALRIATLLGGNQWRKDGNKPTKTYAALVCSIRSPNLYR